VYAIDDDDDDDDEDDDDDDVADDSSIVDDVGLCVEVSALRALAVVDTDDGVLVAAVVAVVVVAVVVVVVVVALPLSFNIVFLSLATMAVSSSSLLSLEARLGSTYLARDPSQYPHCEPVVR
jgi:hypothetical protein